MRFKKKKNLNNYLIFYVMFPVKQNNHWHGSTVYVTSITFNCVAKMSQLKISLITGKDKSNNCLNPRITR